MDRSGGEEDRQRDTGGTTARDYNRVIKIKCTYREGERVMLHSRGEI